MGPFLIALLILAISAVKGLVNNNFEDLIDMMNAEDILQYHDEDFNAEVSKLFSEELLVFTTPWHPLGTEWVLKYAKKIDYFAPVWFDFRVKSVSKNNYEFYIEGDHNVDKAYLEKLKAANPNIQVYPRLYIEGSIYENFFHLTNTVEMSVIADGVAQAFKKYDKEFDGIVFDTPFLSVPNRLQFDILSLTKLIGEKLGNMGKNLIVSVLASQNSGLTGSYLTSLMTSSYKLLMCTYDYSTPKPEESSFAPFPWIKQQIQTFFDETELGTKSIQRKLMMGLPFYGQDVDLTRGNKGVVINNQYLEMLKQSNPKLQWSKETKECSFIYNDPATRVSRKVNYPCLKFFRERLQLFEEYEIGAFIWEAGQGLKYFFELF